MDVDTIVAQATPPGTGALAVVRLSGPDAFGILSEVSDPDPASKAEGVSGPDRVATEQDAPGGGERGRPGPEARRATLTRIVDPDDGTLLDRALVTCFEAPASYTGEDVVEISCHGGWLTPKLLVEACVRAGAREAEPGEFTRRAYLRGKVDLVQAEAIADLIEARSRALRSAAVGQIERGLSRRVSRLRERLIEVEALLAHHVDFPEEDDAPVPLDRVGERAGAFVTEIEAMLATAPEGELLREGALTVFAGRPNVGKSSLYNALLGEERAIVTSEAGTTRDALEATVQLRGFPFRLVDTAGLRISGEGVERLGIEVARRYVERADLVLLCAEAGRAMSTDEMEFLEEVAAPVVLVETKGDLVETKGDPVEEPAPVAAGEVAVSHDASGAAGGSAHASGDGDEGSGGGAKVAGETKVATGEAEVAAGETEVAVGAAETSVGEAEAAGRTEVGEAEGTTVGRVRVSVATGEGLDRLRELLPDLVFSAIVSASGDDPVLTRRRQVRALEDARDEVEAFRAGLADGLPAEVAATHLRSAETALEELLGTVSVDDVLDVVFRDFCVGK